MTIREVEVRNEWVKETAVRIRRYYERRLRNCAVSVELHDKSFLSGIIPGMLITIVVEIDGQAYLLTDEWDYRRMREWAEKKKLRKAPVRHYAQQAGQFVFENPSLADLEIRAQPTGGAE